MKVLVTGGTGFLGQKLAARLNEMGYEVTACGRNKAVGERLRQKGIRFHAVDFMQRDDMISVCRDQQVVFHCGALSSPWGKYEDFYNSNVLGTRYVLEGCAKYGVKRCIHVSTPSIYFDFTDRLNIKETDDLPEKPANMYARTKLLAEKAVDEAFAEGLPVMTIRPRALFGPGDTTILPRLIQVSSRGVPIIDSAKAVIDVTYVDNVVDALLLCQHAPESTLGNKYNITNGEPMTLYTLLEKLFKRLDRPFKQKKMSYSKAYRLAACLEWLSSTILFGKEPLLTRYSVGVLAKSQTLNIEEARRDLGYVPVVSIDEGLERFVQWWRAEANG